MEMAKKVFMWAAISFLIFFVAFNPGGAGELVSTLGNVFVDIFRGVGDFFEGLVPN